MCGSVSHTEDCDCLMVKLPEWLKVEVVDEESNKRCKECSISIAGLPPRLETHRIAAFVSQVISWAEVSSSFEDSGLYGVRIGQEWQRSQVLDAFEGNRRTVNGNPVTVTEWTFKFRAEGVFREIRRRLGQKQELAVGRRAEGVSLSQETDKTKGGELGLAVNQVPRQLPPPSGQDPSPWPHANHGGPCPGGPSPVPRPQRNNPRAGFQYGYHSNITPPAPTPPSFAGPDPWAPLDNSPSRPIRGGMPRSQPLYMGSDHIRWHLAAAVAMAMTPRQAPSGIVPALSFLGTAPLSMVKGTLLCVNQSILLINGRAIRHIGIARHVPPTHSVLLRTGLQVTVMFQDWPRFQVRATLLVRVRLQIKDTLRVSGSLHGRTSLHGRASLQVKASPSAKARGREKVRGKERERVRGTLSELLTGSPRMGMSPPLRPTMLWRESPEIPQPQPQLGLKGLIGPHLRDMILTVLDMTFLIFTVSMTRVMRTLMPSFATSRPLTLFRKGAGTMTQTHGSTVIRTTASPPPPDGAPQH